MTRKVAIFAFNGEEMCFIHALMNAIDMKNRGYDVKLIIEGSATRLVKEAEGRKNRSLPFTSKQKMQDSLTVCAGHAHQRWKVLKVQRIRNFHCVMKCSDTRAWHDTWMKATRLS